MNFQFQKKKFEKNSRVELQSIFRGAKIDEYPLNSDWLSVSEKKTHLLSTLISRISEVQVEK